MIITGSICHLTDYINLVEPLLDGLLFGKIIKNFFLLANFNPLDLELVAKFLKLRLHFSTQNNKMDKSRINSK